MSCIKTLKQLPKYNEFTQYPLVLGTFYGLFLGTYDKIIIKNI